MDTKEFSERFDLLLDSNAAQPMFGEPSSKMLVRLDEYEKSVCLTQAQLALAIKLYNGSYGKSFEQTEELTSYLAPLVRQYESSTPVKDARHIVKDSVIFSLPEDLMFRTYESCVLSDEDEFACEGGEVTVSVVPVTQDEYWRTSRNPFKGTNRRRVLRLAFDSVNDGTESVDKFSELVSKYPVKSYLVRYVKRPRPIVLENLDGLEVEGVSQRTECELNPQLHEQILNDAVALALATRRTMQPQSQAQHS